jgi:hypothetical protein
MSTFLRFLAALAPRFQSQHDRNEAYLAESGDIYELERRMRELDARDLSVHAGSALQVGMR